MKYQFRFHTIALLIFGFLIFSSCDIIDSLKKDKDDDKNDNGDDLVEFVDGISRDILEFVTEQDIAILEDTLGIQIHRGNNPPHLNGSYKVSPVLLKKTNIKNDYEIGHRFADSYLKFYNQNDDMFTIELDHAEVSYETGGILGLGIGRGSYLVGNGNSFSIFSKTVYVRDSGEEADLLYLYSGVLGENGIHNFEYALFMLNNNGHDTVYIQNQTGRSFYDGEGFSEGAPFPSSKRTGELYIRNIGRSIESGLSPMIYE